jgi:hypothetical protein
MDKDTEPKNEVETLLENPYRNILYCCVCGAVMQFQTARKNGKINRVTYVCSSWLKQKQCSHHRFDFYHVDSEIRKALQQEIHLAGIAAQHIESGDLPASYHDTLVHYQGQITQLLEEIRLDADSFQSLHKAFLCDEIDMDQYQAQKQGLTERTRGLGQALVAASETRRAYQLSFTRHNLWLALYGGQVVPDCLTLQQSKKLIERVLLSPEGEVLVAFKHQDQKKIISDILEG